MKMRSALVAGASALLLAYVFVLPSIAEDPTPTGGFHGGVAAGRAGGSIGDSFPGGMPPVGFHGTPSGFHGIVPYGTIHTGPPRAIPAKPGHLASFLGHDFAHLTVGERTVWQHGGWRHVRHRGHWGWWWVVGDAWFFYPGPVYPYPDYIGSVVYYDYYDDYDMPDYYWYYCEDPPGYYPDVSRCHSAWEAVPPES